MILRDPAGRQTVQVLEQNYRNDPVSQERLLNLYEGKTIEFAVRNTDGSTSIVNGRIVRSGYVPHYQAMNRYGAQYQANQMAMASAPGAGQPIIEVGGKLQFSLPGQPLFPTLADDTILIPAFDWILYSPRAARFDAELSYVSGGMSWSSDYNIVAPETGDTLELVGWVTLDNQSGKQFDRAHIKLMAGDVNKVQPRDQPAFYASAGVMGGIIQQPQVTEKDLRRLPSVHASAAHDDSRPRDQAGGVPTRLRHTVQAAVRLRRRAVRPEFRRLPGSCGRSSSTVRNPTRTCG